MQEIHLKILIYPLLIIVCILLNYGVIEHLIIPDECYYHMNGTSTVFDLFYSISSASGGHPEPTVFNFLFTLFCRYTIARIVIKQILNKMQ